MRVDFHTHSTASDGTLAPSLLARTGAEAGIAIMALTDHDGCDGVGEFRAQSLPMRTVAGVELSVDPGPHFDKFHLLGLGIDPSSPALKALLRKVLEGRNERNRRIIGNFGRLGIDLADEIRGYAHGEILARPHFARWLVDHGRAKTVAEAFEKYLLASSPRETRCYEERIRPTQEEAIGALHAAGGLAVLAHPKYGRGEWIGTGPDYAVAERAFAALREKGLDGVEAFYQANTVDENIAFTRLADRLGLLKSAGSDFHGANKPTVTLGMDVPDRFIAPLLERLGAGRLRTR